MNETGKTVFELNVRRDAMGGFTSFEMDDNTVRDLLDEYLRETIKSRMEMFDCDAKIKQVLDRRIEVAVKKCVEAAEVHMMGEARKHVESAVRNAINKTPVRVRIETGGSEVPA